MRSVRSNRRWTVILVPPRPGAKTRRVTISSRTVMSVSTFALIAVAVGATWTNETSAVAASTAARLAESQRTVISLLDSVQLLGAVAQQVREGKLPPRDMIMPVAGRISSSFSTSRLHPLLQIFRAHKGVDVSAPSGTRIVSTADGTVRFVGWKFGYGLTVEIQHTGDIVTRYGHCRSSLVREGDRVNAGQAIALVGSSGLSTGPHVHFEVLSHGISVDPIKYLAESRSYAAVSSAGGTH